MAIANEISVSIGEDVVKLDRVFTGTTTGHFVSADGATELEVTPSVSKAGRRHTVARLRQKRTTEDPLVGTVNVRVNDFVSFNVNRPSDGFTDADVAEQVLGLVGWLTANDNENLLRVIGGQN